MMRFLVKADAGHDVTVLDTCLLYTSGSVMKAAFATYIQEVQAETYPAEEHTFKIDDEVLEKLY